MEQVEEKLVTKGILDKVLLAGFKPYVDFKGNLPKDFTYCWANTKCILGMGYSSGDKKNTRVSPVLDRKKIKSIKDAGKSFCAYYMQTVLKEKMSLYIIKDNSGKLSRGGSELESKSKKDLINGKFILCDSMNMNMEKVDFMDDIIQPQIIKYFGANTLEDVLSTIASGDGDGWSRFKRHPMGMITLDKILSYIEGL